MFFHGTALWLVLFCDLDQRAAVRATTPTIHAIPLPLAESPVVIFGGILYLLSAAESDTGVTVTLGDRHIEEELK